MHRDGLADSSPRTEARRLLRCRSALAIATSHRAATIGSSTDSSSTGGSTGGSTAAAAARPADAAALCEGTDQLEPHTKLQLDWSEILRGKSRRGGAQLPDRRRRERWVDLRSGPRSECRTALHRWIPAKSQLAGFTPFCSVW